MILRHRKRTGECGRSIEAVPSGTWVRPLDSSEGIVQFKERLGCPPQVVLGIHTKAFVAPSPIPVMVGVDYPLEMPSGCLQFGLQLRSICPPVRWSPNHQLAQAPVCKPIQRRLVGSVCLGPETYRLGDGVVPHRPTRWPSPPPERILIKPE
jgi:hypothetical protein